MRTAAIIKGKRQDVRTSETPVNSETTRRYIPEVSNLHIHRRENLKSQAVMLTPVAMRTWHLT
jgi:hypothetical protein